MTPTALKLKIEGMDCAACAIKIENAMKRLPGVGDVNVAYPQGVLSLSVDEDRTTQAAIRQKVEALGYRALDRGPATDMHGHAAIEGAWWKSDKAKFVVALAVVNAAVFLSSFAQPQTAAFAFTLAALFGLVPVARRAYAGATSGTPFSIETLMTVAAIGAIAIGEPAEAAVFVFLFAVGELLEAVAGDRARAGIKGLMDLVPRMAIRQIPDSQQIETVSVEQLRPGDVVLVRPGDRVPSDGDIVDGSSELNEAPVTGESMPVGKAVGDKVFAGSINANGQLAVKITASASDNTIARIIHMVEEAQASKAPTARFIDEFSKWYTPAAMLFSAFVILVPPLVFGADWHTWIYRGLAVLLVACPCALVISTPAAIASGLASGARRGLLIKGGAALETLGKVKTIAFDKTGTLTIGRPRVTDVIALDGSESDMLAKAAAVERGSSHPLGLAIIEAAQQRNLEIPQSYGGAVATPGKAVTARLKSGFVSVGSPRYAAERGQLPTDRQDEIARLEGQGKTVVVVLEKDAAIGLIALRDEPRDDARSALDRIRALGIDAVMLTGDNARTGEAIGEHLGVGVRAELLPADKLEAIAAYKKVAPIAMVGDGINDAPALAAASVGVAMGGGTDVALETADAALLKNRVTGVAELVELSRKTIANIWQNIALALGLKAIFLATTLLGTTPLWMAILADTGATVLVTANALRLLRVRLSA